MDKILVPIIIAMIGNNAFFGLIQFLILRKDQNNEVIKKILSRLDFIDQGLIRMQLLVLISDYPDRVDEIMKLADQYFNKFNGNYYLTSLFKKYLDDSMLTYPTWFNPQSH